MQILRASPEDAATLTDIAFAAKRHWGYPEEWIENWRDALTITPEFIASHEAYLARIEDRAVGFYAFVAPEGNDRVALQHLWVSPEMMGQGIGRSLFRHAVERAGELGFQKLEIESDPNAEGFYLRMGAKR